MKLTKSLTAVQSARKAELEAIIKQGLREFVAVGNALGEIKEDSLYLDDFDTFEEYCREKWGLSRSRGYQLIEAAETAKRCLQVVDIPTEAAARPLTKLPPKEQVKVARVLARSPEPVTARRVAETVQRVARGGLASTIAQARADQPKADPCEDDQSAAARIERWYAEERQRLNEYPMATPDRVVQLILRLLRG